MLLAAWARLARFRGLFPGGEIAMLDGDSAYHLRRILAAVRAFPHVPAFDASMNWPRGGLCHWADGFDVLGAAWVLLAGGGAGEARAKLAAAVFPVVLGLLVVWAVIDLAALVGSGGPARRPVALAAGLLAALVPQGVASSLLGRTDHHVAEALSLLLLVGWALRGLPAPAAAPRTVRAALGWEVAGALAIGGALWLFAGATLYVAVAAAPLLVALALRREPAPLVGSGAPALLGGAALSAVASAPALAAHGHLLSFLYPSALQPLLVAAGGVLLLLAWAAPRALPAAAGSRRARLAVVAAAALLAAAALAAVPAVRQGLHGWLLRRDPWLAVIVEFQPLLDPRVASGPVAALRLFFGSLGLAAPLVLAVAAVDVTRRQRARGLALAWILLAVTGLALLQNRFGRLLAPLLAVAAATALAAVARAALRGRAWSGVVALGLAALWCAADGRLRGQLALPPRHGPNVLQAAALDLADAPPVERGRGAGVLAPWDFGHDLLVLGGRPVVANGFGSYLAPDALSDVERAYRGDLAGLLAIMRERDLGFLVAGSFLDATYAGAPPFAASPQGGVLDLARLAARDTAPLAIGGSGVPAARVPHIAAFLPRFASPEPVPGLAFPLPQLWVYERVTGARLRGRATPGALVVAELPFRENGRPHVWKAWCDAAPDGRFELTVPIPTGWARPTLWTAPAWHLRAGGGAARAVEVPEAAVRGGYAIDAGELPAAGATAAAR
jgi:hypothetical protein